MKLPRSMAGAALAAALLAACGTAPALHYYALEVVTPVGGVTRPPDSTLIQVRRISLPPEMDHRGLTHHQGPTQLNISDSDQWSAPLTDLIQATLSADLGARLGYDHVSARGTPGSTQVALDLDFLALTADDACGIAGQVNWTISWPNGTPRHGTTHLNAPATGCPAGLPAALSTALGGLADQLTLPLTIP